MLDFFESKNPNKIEEIYPRSFVIWPIFINDEFGYDWVTLFWMQRTATSEEMDEHLCIGVVTELAIIDPRLDRDVYRDGLISNDDLSSRRTAIRERLQQFLRHQYVHLQDWSGTQSMADSVDGYIHTAPMPANEHTSGERCYAVIKELFRRISEEVPPHLMFGPMERFVNPCLQRMEMTGLCGFGAMAGLSWRARLALEILPSTHAAVQLNGEDYGVPLLGLKISFQDIQCGPRFPFQELVAPDQTVDLHEAGRPMRTPGMPRQSLRRKDGDGDETVSSFAPLVDLSDPVPDHFDVFGEYHEWEYSDLISWCKDERQRRAAADRANDD